MNLWKIQVTVPQTKVSFIEAWLEPHSDVVTTFETDRLPLWQVEAYLLPHIERSFLDLLLKNLQLEYQLESKDIHLDLVPRIDWLSHAYASFPPFKVGKFYIYGSHCTEKTSYGCIPLEINAATAFGSGEHQSTFGCLLATSILSKKIHPQKILDMGTGTGILALAAAKLWKRKVLAADYDPESVRVAFENAKLNKVAPLIHALLSDGYKHPLIKKQKFDLIFANILARPLIQMAPDLSQCLKPGGYVILAGLLKIQENRVLRAHFHQNLKLIKAIHLGDWSCLILHKTIQ